MDGSNEDTSIGLRQEIITTGNINGLFAKYDIPEEFDLLVIDIDFFDYYVWRALDTKYRPRIVIIEYNAHIPPSDARVVKLENEGLQKWDTVSSYFGASLLAITKLARSKGYELIYCESHGVNAFFVRKDVLYESGCADDIFLMLRPFTGNRTFLALDGGTETKIFLIVVIRAGQLCNFLSCFGVKLYLLYLFA